MEKQIEKLKKENERLKEQLKKLKNRAPATAMKELIKELPQSLKLAVLSSKLNAKQIDRFHDMLFSRVIFN